MTPHAFDCPEADRLVDEALRAISHAINRIRRMGFQAPEITEA